MNTLRRIIAYLKPYRLRLFVAVLCSGGVAAGQGATAWLVAPLLQDIFIDFKPESRLMLPLALLGITILKTCFSYGQSYLMGYVGQWLIADIRQQLFIREKRCPSFSSCPYALTIFIPANASLSTEAILPIDSCPRVERFRIRLPTRITT